MRFILAFILLFLPWIFLSGKFDAFHLVLGGISSAIVALWSRDILFHDLRKSFGHRIEELCRFCLYCVWLFYQIILANFHVVYIAFCPDLEKVLNPKMVLFKTKLKHDVAQFVLANSITLTPGTVTVRIKEGEFLVHSLTDKTAAEVPGEMEDRVMKIFGAWA